MKSCRTKIVCPEMKAGKKYCLSGTEVGKKDCLDRGLWIDYGWPEQGNKYNITQLKVSLEAFFSEMIRTAR